MTYLTISEIVEAHDIVVKRAKASGFKFLEGVSNRHALLMMETQPAQSISGEELYPTIFIKSAFYMRTINGEHVFLDGNKRTSIILVNEFLRKNGYIFEPPQEGEELEKFVIHVAENLLDLKQISIWIEKHSKKGQKVEII